MSDPNYLVRSYKRARNPGSFTGASTIARNRKIKNVKHVQSILSGVKSYQLHFPVRRRHRTRPMLSSYIGDVGSADLADFSNMANDGYKFVLIFNDIFSKKTYFEALKNKAAKTVAEAFKRIFKRFKYPLKRIVVDDGGEFKAETGELFNALGIKKITSRTLRKAAASENRVKWLRGKLERRMTDIGKRKWLDVLEDTEKSYNESISTVTGMAPNSVNKSNQDIVWFNANKKFIKATPQKNSLAVNDLVLLSRYRNLFEKSSKVGWSKHPFRIKEIKKSFGIFYYILEDLETPPNQLPSTYYKTELQKVLKHGD